MNTFDAYHLIALAAALTPAIRAVAAVVLSRLVMRQTCASERAAILSALANMWPFAPRWPRQDRNERNGNTDQQG